MKRPSERRLPYWLGILCLLIAGVVSWQIKAGEWAFLTPAPKTPVTVHSIRPLGAEDREEAETALSKTAFQVLESFSFVDESSLKAWEQKVFKGKTLYEVRQEEGAPYLSSESADASSGLFIKTKHEAAPELFLSWKWRVRDFPKKANPGNLSSREEDDFGARIYVIFLASSLFRSDVVEYIWDETLSPGTYADSAYSDRIKLLVVRSGSAGEDRGGWHQEIRNPLEDYKKLFGKDPKHPIGIIALMSDSDNTRSMASADFADISVKKKL